MSVAKANLELAEKWVEAMNKHDAELLGSLCADDVVSREMAEPEAFEGKTAVINAYKELFSAFPDCTTEIVNRIADEKGVLLEVLWKGTSKGPFRGTPPTGKKVELPIAYVFEIENGKIKKVREYYDALTYINQMGLST